MSQEEEVLLDDGDNGNDSSDVLIDSTDKCDVSPEVNPSFACSNTLTNTNATSVSMEQEQDETGLLTSAEPPPDNLDGTPVTTVYEPCDPLIILNLFQSLSSTTNSLELQMKINVHLKTLTKSPYVFLVPILHSSEEGLIQVINDNILDKEIRFSINSTHLKNAPQHNGYPFVIDDINKDFSEVIEMVVGNKHNTLVYDIKSPRVSKLQTQISSTSTCSTASLSTRSSLDGSNIQHHQQNHNGSNSSNRSSLQQQQIALFVCIAGDSTSRSRYQFYIEDTFRYVLGHLLTAFELFEEKRVRYQCQNLLQVARRLLGKIGDLGQLLQGVMTEAKELTAAERCSLFLLDKHTGELVSKVFDGNEASKEIRIESGKGIAGYVAQTGKLLNIRNAYQHPLFYKGVDESTGFKTRNILCFPICDEEGVIGVAQLCNKFNGFHFDKCDEEVATAFSVYCGISIMHALVHKQVQKAEARYKLSQELLLYHMKVPDTEIQHVLDGANGQETDQYTLDFPRFEFSPRDVKDFALSVQLSMRMFCDLNFITTFQIHEDKLARFILMVQKGYRDTPYHNWWHAFSVAHFAYALMTNLRLIERGIITKMQGFSFLIAAFCHDLDHRGTTNTYQTQSSSPLARLYSSEGSVNERHHLSQAIYILNDSSSKILDGLSTEEFKECIDYLRDLILATDLANHFRMLPHLKKLRSDNISESSNQRLLLSLMITCCDLSDQIKSWQTVQHVAHLVYAEFFAEGDLERQMGLRPDTMMDRKKACIPVLQIEFLTTIIRPTFEMLVQIFPETDSFLATIDSNREHWEHQKENASCSGGAECCEFEKKSCTSVCD
ncbi:cGMP-dependent 3',5'-cyclic phosphodiesterase-like [Malaya genurostris]|uniref:cGMP-dependent 3',5'-cyclic phosphodiesterase-like n=1 Tax=Malaya genurostris TaxID=325434 RepID=UPI0026F394D8|nr:cGMP-dependent 3',5'-cyclic phosphodiesterase-like [Malaya genurostris]XP_058446874.1 cGMP-dependent 3',5'-cyclic phosphodiesterase-like [Malaya genurostris]XP_058446875.1 cGMP-dependent 3',5'-cyclic phosphodiesterase-like [Malaya genurostris]XP_058446876.1 cGMP-dependent 3',5'-cyclic phosphodiesterase-like [Malaya genurostris]XP_058446877.1 cGMP-dependent 3',5'-cyclic phosphodiesterase-like [Malaya genurostris]XP_058446878.1 cGMP-dependent 3',5'-cyclic phosphodiesterase-like [Malaya genuro